MVVKVLYQQVDALRYAVQHGLSQSHAAHAQAQQCSSASMGHAMQLTLL